MKDPIVQDARFLILYFDSTETDNSYRVFRIRNGVNKKREWLISTGYPYDTKETNLVRQYYCYYLEEEVSFGVLKVGEFLTHYRIGAKDKYVEGAPIFVKGKDVLPLRMEPEVLNS